MLPDDWRVRSLGSVLERIAEPVIPEPEVVYREIGIRSHGKGIFHKKAVLGKELGEKRVFKVLPDCFVLNIVFAWEQAVARTTRAELGMIASHRFPMYRPKNGLADVDFLAWFFKSKRGKHLLTLASPGGAGRNKTLGQNEFSKLALPMPPTVEQAKIAKILGTWDQAITTTEKLIRVARDRRSALIYGLLDPARTTGNGRFVRVPVVSKDDGSTSYPPSVQPGIPKLSPTPQGWYRTTLGAHLFETKRPARLAADTEYTLLTVKRSRGGVQRRGVLKGSQVRTASQFIVEKGDFLVSKRQIVHGACGIVPAELAGSIVSNEYAVFRTNEKTLDLRFLRYLSELKYFQQTCFHSSIGVHVEKMIFSTERWLKWEFNIPPIENQLPIVKVLDAASNEVDLLSRRLSALRRERNALMQVLLSGKRRVKLDTLSVESSQ